MGDGDGRVQEEWAPARRVPGRPPRNDPWAKGPLHLQAKNRPTPGQEFRTDFSIGLHPPAAYGGRLPPLTPELAMRHVLCLAVVVFATPLFAAEPSFFFQKNDRIVFLGDSITMLWTL